MRIINLLLCSLLMMSCQTTENINSTHEFDITSIKFSNGSEHSNRQKYKELPAPDKSLKILVEAIGYDNFIFTFGVSDTPNSDTFIKVLLNDCNKNAFRINPESPCRISMLGNDYISYENKIELDQKVKTYTRKQGFKVKKAIEWSPTTVPTNTPSNITLSSLSNSGENAYIHKYKQIPTTVAKFKILASNSGVKKSTFAIGTSKNHPHDLAEKTLSKCSSKSQASCHIIFIGNDRVNYSKPYHLHLLLEEYRVKMNP